MNARVPVTDEIAIRISPFIVVFLMIFSGVSTALQAFDITGRVDTRYMMRSGDNADDHDLLQTHSLKMNLADGLSFEGVGWLRKDLDAREQGLSSSGKDRSDVLFRDLADARNPDQNLEYRVWSAYLRHEGSKHDARLGRMPLYDYGFPQVDGLMGGYRPMQNLWVEGFFGKPWHYDKASYYDPGEVVAGAGSDIRLLENRWVSSVRYLHLQERTLNSIVLAGEDYTDDNFSIRADNLVQARSSYRVSDALVPEVAAAYLTREMKDVKVGVSGMLLNHGMEYRVQYYRQLMDIESLSDRLNLFSTLLTASRPHQKVNAAIFQSLSPFISFPELIRDVTLEAGYEYRGPNNSAHKDRFNPVYHALRLGAILAAKNRLTLHAYGEAYITEDNTGDSAIIAGEIAKDWRIVRAAVGTGYFVQKYYAFYGVNQVNESFYAREYYADIRYYPARFYDMGLRVILENAEYTALGNQFTDSQAPGSSLGSIRDFLRVNLNFGVRF